MEPFNPPSLSKKGLIMDGHNSSRGQSRSRLEANLTPEVQRLNFSQAAVPFSDKKPQ